MTTYYDIFPARPIIGMIHVRALPGTPRHHLPLAAVIDKALHEADIYCRAGIDAIAIENMHDIPYLKGAVGPEIVAAMTVVGREVKRLCQRPCGIQILAGANEAALAAALAAGLDFVRAEGYVFGHVADEGWIEAAAGPLKRYQKQIGAEHILILTDIKKKHSAHAATADVDIVETAKSAKFFLSDGVIVTGTATGVAADLREVDEIKRHVDIPVLIGSGVTPANVAAMRRASDGLIIGSYFKHNGDWANDLDPARIKTLLDAARD